MTENWRTAGRHKVFRVAFRSEKGLQDLLQKLIHSFDDSPATSGRLMRELMERERAAFVPAALGCLRQAADTRGYRYLVALLASNDMLTRFICDASLAMPAALAVAQMGIRVNPTLDAVLARAVVNGLEEGGRGEEQAIRTLEILGTISSGRRLLPLLTNLLQYPNPRIRSKVALLMSKRSRSSRWVEQRKEEEDPRVRANAIEGLWDSTDQDACAVLWEATTDPSNRLAGNGVVGLYRAGDVRSINRILEMSIDAEPHFRATAAWAMGESGDPRFLAALGRMLADGDKMVRARAFRSLSAVRQRVAASPVNEKVRAYLWHACRTADGKRRLEVAVVNGGQITGPLPATRFLLTEGTQPITDYTLSRRAASNSFAIGWGLPRLSDSLAVPVERSLRECLRWKRPSHAWSILPYTSTGSAVPDTEGDLEPRFMTNAAAIASVLDKPANRLDAATGPGEASRLLLSLAGPLSGERHLVLISAPEDYGSASPETEMIGAKARCHGIAFHGLALSDTPPPWLETLCKATGGNLLRATAAEGIRAAIQRIFWGMQYQDEITYRLENAATDESTIRVQVGCDEGIGEDWLELG